MNKSTIHGLAIFTNCELANNGGVPRSQKDLAYRLELTREALGISPAELCRATGLKTNQWSQYVDPNDKRRITPKAIYLLKDEFGITFEWIYDGDRSTLKSDLRDQIKKVEKAGGVDLTRTRGRRAKIDRMAG